MEGIYLAKRMVKVYLTDELLIALEAYQDRHRGQFDSRTAAVEHLLRRALASPFAEEQEALIVPELVREVTQAVQVALQTTLPG